MAQRKGHRTCCPGNLHIGVAAAHLFVEGGLDGGEGLREGFAVGGLLLEQCGGGCGEGGVGGRG